MTPAASKRRLPPTATSTVAKLPPVGPSGRPAVVKEADRTRRSIRHPNQARSACRFVALLCRDIAIIPRAKPPLAARGRLRTALRPYAGAPLSRSSRPRSAPSPRR